MPLGLPGSRLIRLQPEIVTKLRAVSEYLRNRCDTFLSLPGLHSYYFWAEKEPPTGFNVGPMYMLTDHQRGEIVEKLAKVSRPCILINRQVLDFWMKGKPLNPQIATYVNENYQYEITIYGNELWTKKDAKSSRDVNSRPDLVGEIKSEPRLAFPEVVRPPQGQAKGVPKSDQ